MRQSACLVFNPLGEAVLTSTHNLCFGAKIRKIGIPPAYPSFFYIKVGFKGVFIARTCFPDVLGVNYFVNDDYRNTDVIISQK